jgi:hypothetical protein
MKIGKKSMNFEQTGKKKSPLSSNGDLMISLIVPPQYEERSLSLT